MTNKIKIIKTLNHLNPLFIENGEICVYSNMYSLQIYECISEFKLYLKKELKFSKIIDLVSKISEKNNINPGILNEFKIGKKVEYNRVDKVDYKLDFSIKGDIITIWPVGYENPLRLEFFGEELEQLYEFDSFTGRKIKDLDFLIFSSILPSDINDVFEIKISDNRRDKFPISNFQLSKVIFTNKDISGIEKFHTDVKVLDTDFEFPQLFFGKVEIFEMEARRLEKQGYKVIVNSSNRLNEYLSKLLLNKLRGETFKLKLEEGNQIVTTEGTKLEFLPAGFLSKESKFAFFTDREIFGTVSLKNNKIGDTENFKRLLREFEGEIVVDSFVVHEDYGVAQYKGLKQENAGGVISDYLLLEFDDEAELYVPLTQLNKITKYLGSDGHDPKLTKLGTGIWKRLKEKVKAKTYLTAKELIEHYALRESSKAEAVLQMDSTDYDQFVKDFPYSETKDQMTSINEIISDLEKQRPMNRLLVGDVGFGKTEVIMRAAFKVAENGGQVAVLAPTTVLVSQHENVFRERFKNTKLRIGGVSRFKTKSENAKIIEEANAGKLDIIVGTHRLLSGDVKFKNLNLLVVDEEQKFGVKQKEKIKKLNYGCHVLSVSATPIPRSLSLALSTIHEISIITTPPKNRKPVTTEIIFENWGAAANAIQKEVSRGGQVYFVHNRVASIQGIISKLRELVPGIKFDFAHGQMPSAKLDKIIAEFYLKKFDVLVSTSIIENGLDLPNVNTIIMHDAHKFGLSTLYQMRGRVGRSDRQAYCYLMCPTPGTHIEDDIPDTLTQEEISKFLEVKKKKKVKVTTFMDRLQTIVDNQDLGAGFKVASRDLEIRGAGNVLGDQQHGHIEAVGYALYMEMLADAVEKVKQGKEITGLSTT